MNGMQPIRQACALVLLSLVSVSAAPHSDLTKALAAAKAQDMQAFIYVYDSV